MNDYVELDKYPALLRQISLAVTDCRRELKDVSEAAKVRIAEITRFGNLEGTNDVQRKASLLLKMAEDVSLILFYLLVNHRQFNLIQL